ncbi:helix-turn-helix transcriptional regulator [Salinactinospora qingdaonensis]
MSEVHQKQIASLPELVGREKEVETLSRMLRSTTGPVVIAGPIGSGKSRLALEVANALRHLFPRGIHILDCSAAESLEQLTRELVEYSGEIGDGPENHGGQLIIVDNYAPGHEGVAWGVLTLVSRSANLSVLVTSNESVRIYGGQIFELDPLPVPPASPETSLEDVLSAAATKLLIRRSGYLPAYTSLTEEHKLALLGLVNDLDGLPLAIELAAPWLRVLDPLSLRRRLAEGIGILSVNWGAVSLRHDSMREALERHFRVLPPSAQDMLVQLSRYDEFTFDSVHSLLSDPPESVDQTLRLLIEEHLLRVTNKNMVQPLITHLNLVRTFVQEKTGEIPAGAGMRSYPPPQHVEDTDKSVLTPRQRQVAGLVANGMTNREISKRLGIAEWTAVNHVREVMRKLQLSSRVQIANWVSGKRESPETTAL